MTVIVWDDTLPDAREVVPLLHDSELQQCECYATRLLTEFHGDGRAAIARARALGHMGGGRPWWEFVVAVLYFRLAQQ